MSGEERREDRSQFPMNDSVMNRNGEAFFWGDRSVLL